MAPSSSQRVDTLQKLIRQRHAGDGWIVFEELRRNSWYQETRADAMALGMWRSNRYELHGFEVKVDRRDVKRELVDPRKSEGIGMYCHYWWLVLDDLKLIEDLVIPDSWGILVAAAQGNGRILKVHRKAPRVSKPRAFDAFFVVSMIRKATKDWVPQSVHKAVIEERDRLKYPTAVAGDPAPELEAINDKRDLERLRASIANFEQASGVKLLDESQYRFGDIGAAVKVALELRHEIGAEGARRELRRLSDAASTHGEIAKQAAGAAIRLRDLLKLVGHDTSCLSHRGRRCSCGFDSMSEVEKELLARGIEKAIAAEPSSSVTSGGQ